METIISALKPGAEIFKILSEKTNPKKTKITIIRVVTTNTVFINLLTLSSSLFFISMTRGRKTNPNDPVKIATKYVGKTIAEKYASRPELVPK